MRYQEKLQELESLGAHVVAATSDTKERTLSMVAQKGITFPVAYGLTKDDVAAMDPWWTEVHHGLYI